MKSFWFSFKIIPRFQPPPSPFHLCPHYYHPDSICHHFSARLLQPPPSDLPTSTLTFLSSVLNPADTVILWRLRQILSLFHSKPCKGSSLHWKQSLNRYKGLHFLAPCELSNFLAYYPHFHSLHFSYIGLLAVPQTPQARASLRAFELAVDAAEMLFSMTNPLSSPLSEVYSV